MSDKWNFFFRSIDGAPASLFVDLGIRKEVPDPSRPRHLWIRLTMNAPRADGFSSSEEFQKLKEIEDSLERSVAERIAGRYVGRITTAGRRDYHFHAASEKGFDGAVGAALSSHPGYRFTIGSEVDAGWTHYLQTLHPTDEERQGINNRSVLEALKKNGDPLTRRRRIDHWLYFRSQADADAVARALAPLGFEVVDCSPAEDDAQQFRLRMHRVDLPSYRTIDEVTLPLFRLARAHGGKYDGWETSVEREV